MVNWGNGVPDDSSVKSDEETEVESILDVSNTQTDPMDIDVEEPISRQSYGQAERHQELRQQTEVRKDHPLPTSKLVYDGFWAVFICRRLSSISWSTSSIGPSSSRACHWGQ